MRVIFGVLSLLWKVYIAIVFFVFAIVLYPFFLLTTLSSKTKRLGFKLFILWSYGIRLFCLYPVKKIQHAPTPEGPYIIIANHTSYLDIFFMYSILPKHQFMFLGKSEILKYPIVNTYFKSMNVPVYRHDKSRAGRAYLGAINAYQQGYSLAIFPEGTFPEVDLPKMVAFKGGAFKLAKELNAPLLPLTFMNNYKLFSDPMDWLGPARPGIAVVHIHELVSIEQVQLMSVEALKDHCHRIISKPLEEAHPELY
jgi:1-acyl-sn-glycerol-3-phosphate acyltransferase